MKKAIDILNHSILVQKRSFACLSFGIIRHLIRSMLKSRFLINFTDDVLYFYMKIAHINRLIITFQNTLLNFYHFRENTFIRPADIDF